MFLGIVSRPERKHRKFSFWDGSGNPNPDRGRDGQADKLSAL